MFDIGFSELMVIGIVALLVIGPERLPKVARTLGHLLGRAQRYVNDVKSDINREMQLDELKKLQTQVVDSARSLEDSVRKEYDVARTGFDSLESPVRSAVAELEATARATAAEVENAVAPAPLSQTLVSSPENTSLPQPVPGVDGNNARNTNAA
jgi:sec-independent protein translocase protein TatB